MTRQDDRIRVITQLEDAGSGRVVWSGSHYSALDTGRLFEIQNTIADEVAPALGQPYGVIAATEAAERAHFAFSAYDCVLQPYAYYRAMSVAGHAAVRDCLEAAVEADPDHAQPWAMLAYVYLDEERYHFNPRGTARRILDRALEAARRAEAPGPNSDVAQEALLVVHYHRGEFDAFRKAAERALALNPNNPDILADIGHRMAALGDWDRGLAYLRQALDLSPDPPGMYHFTPALGAYVGGDHRAALEEASKMNLPHVFLAEMLIAAIHGQLGQTTQARASVDRLRELYPDIAFRARAEMERLYYREDTIRPWLEGLRKAGLPIPE